MVNKFYKKGRRKKYKIVKELREKGFDIAQRSAGSKSPVDIWAVNTKEKKILLVQAKPKNYSDKKTQKLHEDNKELSGMYLVSFEVM